MNSASSYETFLRNRITELRIRKSVSEHRMSLDLGKSGSYIRGITSGIALPSVRELFNIMNYFEVTPAEFFNGSEPADSIRTILREKLMALDDVDLEKVSLFIDWIRK